MLLGMPVAAFANPLDGIGNLLTSYQPDVVVADPFIEMHTGPGRGYPIFYVAGQGDQITILKRKTDWFKIQLPRGSFDVREGWVHIDQMRQTLDLEGNPLVIAEYGMDEFTGRRWEFGLGGGDIEGAATINGNFSFNLNPYIGRRRKSPRYWVTIPMAIWARSLSSCGRSRAGASPHSST